MYIYSGTGSHERCIFSEFNDTFDLNSCWRNLEIWLVLGFFAVVSAKPFNKGFTEAAIRNFKRALKPIESEPEQAEFLLPAEQQ